MPNQRVELYARQLTGRLQRRLDQGLRFRILLLIFDFFGRLPEEQIRADRGAEHRHNDRKIVPRELDVRAPRTTIPAA
jgi:hypothetical protein